MKLTKAGLLKKTPCLFASPDEVYAEFQDSFGWGEDGNCKKKEFTLPNHLVLLYADYTYENYSGDAYVLGYNEKNNQFFEVHGSHCSCYGLEDQWDEEYYDDVKQLQACIEKRFEGKSDWSRYAYSSAEFKNWMEG